VSNGDKSNGDGCGDSDGDDVGNCNGNEAGGQQKRQGRAARVLATIM
jgi:hypothetical protein